MASLGFIATFCMVMVLVSGANGNFDLNGEYGGFGKNLILKGDSYTNPTTASLVCADQTPTPSYGAIFYQKPYHFFHKEENRSLSFTVDFICAITVPVINPSSLGNGFSFIISATTRIMKSGFGFSENFVAITFDNRIEASNPIPVETFVRVFVDSLFPCITVTTNFNLRVSQILKGMIVYDGNEKLLNLYLGNSQTKSPPSLVLNRSLDLSIFLSKEVALYVGMVGTSKSCGETYDIQRLAFKVEKVKTKLEDWIPISSGIVVVGAVLCFLIIPTFRAWAWDLFTIRGMEVDELSVMLQRMRFRED